ncbi:MAG TPA: hypothetical protein VMZ53_31850 [Kofleriaceae bacterium]|nr:hypothetical protein [Kofleriaceae bacterium]
MQKTLPKWAFGVLSFVGVALMGSMVLNWIDIDGLFSRTGVGLAWSDSHWLFLVPLAGAALLATAATRSPHTRLVAIGAGLLVAGYVLFNIAHSIVHAGLDTWLILGGAGTMLAGVPSTRRAWRAVGGLMVIAGFVAPWVDYPLFKMLRHNIIDNGVGNVLWAIPVGGVLGLFSVGNKGEGAKLAALGGSLVYGSLLLVIGLIAYTVFGLGAWIALGASATALVLGVLVRDVVPGSTDDE